MDSTRIDLDGLGVEVRRVGSPATPGPVLVFLHEGLGSVSSWRDFPDRVAAATGLAGLVYSRAGYGRSDAVALPRPLDYMRREAADTLPALLDRLGLDRVVLVGHSDGASIALIHAALPGAVDRVVGAVVMAPHSFVEPMCLAAIARAADSFRAGALRQRLARHHGDNVDCAFWGWNGAWLDPGFTASFDLRPDLARITCPVLVIQGEDDEYGTPAQVDVVVRRVAGPVRALLLPACGHSPQRDQGDRVIQAIRDFAADPIRDFLAGLARPDQ